MKRLLAALVVVLIAALFAVTWIPVRQSRALWLAHHDGEAIGKAESWSRLHLWPAQYHQLLAAAYLEVGNHNAAKEHLAAIGSPWISAIAKDEVARRLKLDDFIAYDAASHERDTPVVVRYRQAIEQRKQAGSYPLVFDRNGQAIAMYQIANKDLVAINRDFAPLMLTFAANLPRLGTDDTLDTTLDPEIQKAALQALGGFRGALVAIDPRTNELLAVASTAADSNLAFDRQYEPGSIVKVLTGLNALESGVDVRSMFPYDCKGDLMIDGRHFGDWIGSGHGVLPAIDDALAQSCNIAFADIGLRVGADRLHRFMSAAGFDQQADLGAFQVPLGKSVGQTFNRYETALYSIGLAHESVNALHVAMIGSMMANRGVMTAPQLLRARRSIIGEMKSRPAAPEKTKLASPEHAEVMVQAMVAVATNPKGTGRRAAVEGLPMAMKTGTAGSRADGGLEAVIVAFAPVDHPRIAFGIIAEDAGPAEFAGAKIAHDFIAAWRH
ncbi:MAG TPA: penicillin-binding transpeptidase domain-containing protein [Thermoanaerobaculia bacterium]|nr:penicillin-binding transpeptidase domain-containing protein [Thermoanaerobaculia bacterium]